MNAMEKMVANMLGMTPEQMHETLNGFRATIETLKKDLDTIKSNQALILEAVKNDGRTEQ